VAEVCSYVAVVYAGEIIEYGTVEDIFDRTAHPYTKGLFGSLPRLNSTEPRLKPISGLMPDPTQLPKGCAFCERCPIATDKCAEIKPPTTELSPGHTVNCFYAEEGR